MGILSIKSNNPDLSFILSKNPENMIGKKIGHGNTFGWFSENGSKYHVVFKDGDDEVTYKTKANEQFEYLNTTRFNSTMFVLNVIEEYLRSAFKSNEYSTMTEKKIDNGGYDSEVFINMMYISQERNITLFQKYFEGEFDIEYQKVAGDNYSLKFKTTKSVYELLNFVGLFSIFQAIYNDDAIWIKEENIVKWMKSLNVVKAGFFMRFVFKKNFFNSQNLFIKHKEELEKSDKEKIEFVFGDTWEARYNSIFPKLSLSRNVLEVGCGEGRLITRIAPQLKNNEYHAIDIDAEVLKTAERKVNNKKLNNVLFYNSFENYKEFYDGSDLDIILPEVIEHMKEKEAVKLCADILSLEGTNKLILTTPDVRFNQFYIMDKEMRHKDHVKEYTKDEFIEFANKICKKSNKNFSVSWFPIGDIANDISTTQGVIFEKK